MSLEERDKAETERRDTNNNNEEIQEDNTNGEPANGDTQDPQDPDSMVDATPPREEQTQDEPGNGRESEGQEEPDEAGESEGQEEPDEAGESDGQEEPDEAGETRNGLPGGLKRNGLPGGLVVIQLGQGRATMGVWKPDADPHLETVEWEKLEDVLEAVPNAVQQALESWEESPRRPKYVKPKPPRKNQRSKGKPKDEDEKGAGTQPATRQPELQPAEPQTGMARLF